MHFLWMQRKMWVQNSVAASTQNQAFNALIFLYKRVLLQPLENVSATRSRKEPRIPVVLTREEVKRVLTLLEGTPELVVKLLYGCGLRITEAVRLRVQDIDYGYKQVTVRNGKGNKDRVTPFPAILECLLKNHLERVMAVHERDLEEGFGVYRDRHEWHYDLFPGISNSYNSNPASLNADSWPLKAGVFTPVQC